MAMLIGSSTSASITYPSALSAALAAGWVMVSEGPSGAQLRKPKQMRGLDKLCLISGMVCFFFFWPVALVLILLAVLDYAFLTKERTAFLSRDNPAPVK
jgi:hypothetical protein